MSFYFLNKIVFFFILKILQTCNIYWKSYKKILDAELSNAINFKKTQERENVYSHVHLQSSYYLFRIMSNETCAKFCSHNKL